MYIINFVGSCVRFDRQAYTIREGGNSLQVGLAINQRASYNFNVNVYSVDLNASKLFFVNCNIHTMLCFFIIDFRYM